MTTFFDQSNIAPIWSNCSSIRAMRSYVSVAGWTFSPWRAARTAAFSAGSPKASNPMGKSTW